MDLARVLQIAEVIVPPAAGVFSAVGLIYAKQEMNLSSAFLHLIEDAPISRSLAELEWKGVPKGEFIDWCEEMAALRLEDRPHRWST